MALTVISVENCCNICSARDQGLSGVIFLMIKLQKFGDWFGTQGCFTELTKRARGSTGGILNLEKGTLVALGRLSAQGWHDIVFGVLSAMKTLDCVIQRVHYLISAFFILFDMLPPILRIPTNRFEAFIGRTYTNPSGLG